MPLTMRKVVSDRANRCNDLERKYGRAVLDLVVAVRAHEDAFVQLLTQRVETPAVRTRDVEHLQSRFDVMEGQSRPVARVAAQLAGPALLVDHPAFHLSSGA